MEKYKLIKPKDLSIESIIGQSIIINPQFLLNKGLLFTTQNWVDRDKISRAFRGLLEPVEDCVCAFVSDEKIHGKIQRVLTMSDGNHRTGIACLKGAEISVYIEGLYPRDKKRYGFNRIKNQVIKELNLSGYDI